MKAEAWQRYAACRGLSTEDMNRVFFPATRQGANPESTFAEARSYCDRCPVATECLAMAMAAESGYSKSTRYGMFGGKTPVERWVMTERPRAYQRAKAPDEWIHGLVTTYNNHGCRCGDCTEARRIYMAGYRERQRRRVA